MNSYATYRIAETIRVLIFLMLSILLFSLYPITPVMIVLLAMLNDIPIMMIAYDNTKISQGPARWHMRRVLSVATLLGVAGVVASFLLLLIGQNILQLDLLTLRTLVFLKLAVAGHMTIYLTRTGEKYFWNRPLPAPALFVATETTQLLGTLFAVYGIFMQSIGWGLAAFVWVYALAFFIINNFVKVYFYKLMEAR